MLPTPPGGSGAAPSFVRGQLLTVVLLLERIRRVVMRRRPPWRHRRCKTPLPKAWTPMTARVLPELRQLLHPEVGRGRDHREVTGGMRSGGAKSGR
jgi:hypothetical protein